MASRNVICLYRNGESPRIHVGHMEVEQRGGQVHVHLHKDDRTMHRDAAVFTHGEALDGTRFRRETRSAGITWWRGRPHGRNPVSR